MALSPEENGFRWMLRQKGRDLKVISGPSAGKKLRATVNRIGEYILSSGIDTDPRGKFSLETPVTGCPELSKLTMVQDIKNSEKYRLTEIGLNSPDYSKKFLMVLGVPGKDSWA